MKQEAEKQYMLEIVQSQEAQKVYEETIYNLDPDAFTDKGKILTYEVDIKSIKKNPMGGVNVNLFVNNDVDMVIYNIIDMNEGGYLDNDDGSYSSKLKKILEE